MIESKAALAVVKKQKDTGIWGGNLLGLAPSAAQGIKDVGTIPNYRRLLQLGWPRAGRPFKLADRVLFRLLSPGRGPRPAVRVPEAGQVGCRGRGLGPRDHARGRLGGAGRGRLRRRPSAPRRRAQDRQRDLPVSPQSARREAVRQVGQADLALHPEAHPPSWYSVAMLAVMPNLQRERAGFTERLGHYLAQPAPKKAFVIQVGKRTVKPQHLLLGDPIEADAKGMPKDIPLALHYIELMARMGALQWAPVATKVLGRLLPRTATSWASGSPKNLQIAAQGGQQDHLPLLSAAPRRQDHRGARGRRHLPAGADRQALGLAAGLRLSLRHCTTRRSHTYYYMARIDLTPLRLHPHRKPGLRGPPHRRARHRLRHRQIRRPRPGQRLQRAGGAGHQRRRQGRCRAAPALPPGAAGRR